MPRSDSPSPRWSCSPSGAKENTTVVEIAERAGLTKSTFFRHFPDKREVLFGGETMSGLTAKGIAGAPDGVTPLEAVAHALETIGREVFTADRRAFGARRRAVIAADPELREREALKGLGLVDSMIEALRRRGVPGLAARVAAELGALAWSIAYDRWSDTTNREDFGDLASRTLVEVRATTASLS